MSSPRYPLLYQINTRVWLTRLGRQLGRRATLDDVSNEELNRWAEAGFDSIWLLSVWQTGAEGQRVSRTNPEWRHIQRVHDRFPNFCFMAEVYGDIPEGCQQTLAGAPHPASHTLPSLRDGVFTSFHNRWCASRPPANGSYPSGISDRFCHKAPRQNLRFGLVCRRHQQKA
jgi:hypothetical protein